jgi:hypothetical protein
LGSDHKWRWELLAFDQTVLKASAGKYKEYETCLADAEEHGYHFSPSRSTRPAQDRQPRQRRSYKIAKRADKEGSGKEATETGVGEAKVVTEVG